MLDRPRFARDDNSLKSELSAQALHQSAKGFFVTAVPAPLALLDYLHEPGLGENRHVMGDGGLGEAHALFNIAGAKASVLCDRGSGRGSRATLFESPQDAAARRVSNGVQRVVERCGRGHGD
jgi:hypothetical protein